MIKNNLDMDNNTISIYGEWCGGNIQKGVGICNLEKSFFIFGVKITPNVDPNDLEAVKKNPAFWVDSSYLKVTEKKIYNVEDYQTYSIDIDFNMPQLVQNQLSEITMKVEEECPIAKSFGFTGVGEGVVWTCEVNGIVYRFKVKGEKHSSSKVKTLAAVDVDKLNSIKEFVDYAVTESRFNQAVEKVFGTKENMDVKKMGDFIRWIVNDVIKEESDTMASNGIEPKDVNKYVSAKAREMFFAVV